MKRREFIDLASKTALGTTALTLTGREAAALPLRANRRVTWEMATSWPASLDTIYGGAQTVCETVARLTDGRFIINPHPAGELTASLEVMPAVADGVVPIGHTAAYYYIDSMGLFTAFGTCVPFGLTARQRNAWLYDAGGLPLLQQLYAERFGLIQFPAGNTGAQMGGWFNTHITTLTHLDGLKMRIGGLGAAVLSRLGVEIFAIGGGGILEALQVGTIDAAEWVGPYDDERLGLHTAAMYYYYPGWWEAGPTLELQINLDAWNDLPRDYQNALEMAAYRANTHMLAAYDARNNAALQRLLESGTQLRAFSEEILNAAYAETLDVLIQYREVDTDFAAVHAHWAAFKDGVQSWHSTNELAYMNYVGTLHS